MSTDPRLIGERLEALLDGFRATGDAPGDAAEELVRLVTELYGAALARVVGVVAARAPALLEDLAADELVGGLLAVHDLHPVGLAARVERALESVRPVLARHGGDVELLDVDADAGAVHLRLLGSCDGCPSSAATLQGAVERAILDAAPEVGIIDVEATDQVVTSPVAFTHKPRYDACPVELVP